MIVRILLLSFALSLGACHSLSHAQEVREVNGEKYITHKVQKGQTLFAISKHYAIPIEAILAANPAARQGLSLDQVLLLPVKAQVKKELKTAPALMDGELAHKVAKKETLFGIARKYGVDQEVLLKRNPSMSAGVKEGMIVVVPVQGITSLPTQQVTPAVEDNSRMHVVQPGETVYSLSKLYALDPEAIQTANGGLANGLVAGTYIRIPAAKVVETVVAPMEPVRPFTGTLQVAYLLPFSLVDNDSLQARNSAEYKGMYGATDAAVQFWAGSRMALDSLERMGFRANVTVLDVGDDARTWTPVLKDPAVAEAQLCIGPFHRAAIEALSRNQPNTHIVCPAPQSNKVLLGHPNVSKVLGGRPDQLQQMARHIAARYARENVMMCSPDIPTEKELREQMRSQLDRALEGQPSRARDSVMVVRTAKRDVSELINKLSATQVNVIIAPSEDLEFVTSLVTRLADVAGKRIVLFGSNSWLEMNTLDLMDLVTLDTHIPASTWIDRNDARVKNFITAYRERFQNEPGEYAFLGYDVSMFYLSGLQRFGMSLPAHFEENLIAPLHTDFRLQRSGDENGFRNESSVLLHFTKDGLQKAAK